MFGIGSILFILLLLPLNIFISLIAEKEMAGAIITGFISLVFGAIILLLILQQLKDIRLNLKPDCLELAIVFRFLPFLNKRLLRYVRVNRVETGYFILSLGLDTKTENIDKLFKLLIALGSYGLKQISNRFIDRLQEIPLWSVDSSLKPRTGPTIGDLLYLENLLEKGLRLSEKPIQSSE